MTPRSGRAFLAAVLGSLSLAGGALCQVVDGPVPLASGLLAAAAGSLWTLRKHPAGRPLLATLLSGTLLLALSLALWPVEAVVLGRLRQQSGPMLDERVADLRSRWSGLLDLLEEASRMPAPLLEALATAPREEAFQQLADWSQTHPILGSPAAVALFDETGNPVAWAGPIRSLIAPTSRNRLFSITPIGTSSFLVCLRVLGPDHPGGVRVELLVRQPSQGASEAFARALGFDSPSRPGEVLAPGEEMAAAGGSTVAGVGTSAARGQLVRLEDREGQLLALARVEPQAEGFFQGRFQHARGVLSELVIALALTAGLVLLRFGAEGQAALSGLLLGSVVAILAALRLAASPLLRGLALPDSLTGPGLFAVPAPFGLLASPADLLLSTLTLLVATSLLTAPLRRSAPLAPPSGSPTPGSPASPPRIRHTIRLLLALAGAWGLAVAILFAIHLPFPNSRLNPIRFRLLEPELPRLALQASAFALTAASLQLLLTALWGTGAGRSRWTLASAGRFRLLVVGLATAITGACLLAGGERASRLLVEHNLAREVTRLEDRRDSVLSEVLNHAGTSPLWSALRQPPSGPPGPALAFEYWSRTELAVDGLKSEMAVLDADGTLRSEFTYNLPPGIYRSSPTAPAASPTSVRSDAYTLLTLRIRLLRGETPLLDEGEVVGRLVTQISREPDNLTFFTRNDPLVAALFAGGRDPIYEEYLGGDPVLMLYSATGEVLHSTALRPPPIEPGLAARLTGSGSVWRQVEVEGRPHRLYYFPVGTQIAAIGYPVAGWSERISAFVRFALLALAGSLLVRAAFFLASHPRAGLQAATIGWVENLRVSYSRRLLAILLLASMLPLLGLSAYIRAQVRDRTRTGIETAGISALETARRLLEDYLVSASAEPADEESHPARIGDDALFWLSRVVRQDLSVFVDGQLAAASRPDLYATGLLSPCLDGDVARQILHRRAPYALKEESVGPEKVLFIYAPIDLPDREETGVLGVPLTAPEREHRQEADALGEGLLTATALLGMLLAAIAVATSRRISGPIRELTRATARVAEGDYSVRLPVVTRDETGAMADSFNKMSKALEGQRRDLRRRGDYIEKILLNATTGVISTDPSGQVRTINPAARLLLGLERELGGRPLRDLLATTSGLDPIARLLQDAWEAGDVKIEREVDLASGAEERRLRCVVLPLREQESGPPGRILLLEDLTEIVRSNRLAAWAEMARSIAHEIKNPLTPIQLSAEHLLRLHRESDPGLGRVLEECVRTILSQVAELREISSEFSSYARLPALQMKPTDPTALVREVLHPYLASPPPSVRIEEDLRAVPPVLLDARVLRRTLVNLVENAFQAMPDGGVLRVRVGEDGSRRVSIEISDTGEGMDEATLARIFEPYFSTRETGTGLGLAISRRAVEEHGGTLTACSRAGAGTVMTITLPAARSGVSEPERAPASPEGNPF